MPKIHSNHTILTRIKEKIDVRLEQFGLKNSYSHYFLVKGSLFELSEIKKMKFDNNKINLFLSILFISILVIYFSSALQRWNGEYSKKYISPDGKYRIEELNITLLATYTREIFNGSWKVSWDCTSEPVICKEFSFAIGEGNTSIILPPHWYEFLLAYIP